jgi:hypothetical protein
MGATGQRIGSRDHVSCLGQEEGWLYMAESLVERTAKSGLFRVSWHSDQVTMWITGAQEDIDWSLCNQTSSSLGITTESSKGQKPAGGLYEVRGLDQSLSSAKLPISPEQRTIFACLSHSHLAV